MPSSRNGTADVQLSKSLSWILRHAAPSLGLKLAPDGYVPVSDVLALEHKRFRGPNGLPKYTVEDVARVVEGNDKHRFSLDYRDVSKKGGQGSFADELSGNDHVDVSTTRKGLIESAKPGSLDRSMNSNSDGTDEGASNKALCIRANQGHSIKGLEFNQLLTPLTKEELSDPGLSIIHGTTRRAWEDHIRGEGLGRMKRNHIHFASGLPPPDRKRKLTHENKHNGTAPISGIRSSSEIYIFVDGTKCAEDGVLFYRSDNGVILTAGVDEQGMLPIRYFEKVVYAFSGKVVWGKGDDAGGERK